jgi:hypothetical protein
MQQVQERKINMSKRSIFFRVLFSLFVIVKLSACSSSDKKEDKRNIIKASKLWIGSWTRNVYQSSGKLEILNVHNDSIQFELHASSGGHESGVEGIAIASDTAIAVYSSKGETDSCKIEFRLARDSIIVRQIGNKCLTGIGVKYDGVYKNENDITIEDEEGQNKTLFDLEIFQTKEKDSIFRVLVGDKYSLFVKTTQLTSEDDDLDSLNSIVKSSGVRGLFTLMENIIMIDSTNTIWAAAIDDRQRVLYFTNNKAYKNKLPKTIDQWRENFKEYPVIYN